MKMKKVLIFDTDILCVYLQIPKFEECGPLSDRWTKARIDQLIIQEEQAKTIFVLPLAAIIETGNHGSLGMTVINKTNQRKRQGVSSANGQN